MCGIIAVLRRPAERPTPDLATLRSRLEAATRRFTASVADPNPDDLGQVAGTLLAVDAALHGTPGIAALLDDAATRAAMDGVVDELDRSVSSFERNLDAGDLPVGPQHLEALNAALVGIKDAVWAISRDRLRNADAVADLLGAGDRSPAAVAAYASIQTALSAIDRLEVRGRDSAGLQVLVRGHGLDLSSPEVRELLTLRSDPLFTSLAVDVAGDVLSFVYKAAAEIGELGDNTARLRAAIRGDDLLRRAVEADTAEVTVLGHTRWASVGIVSEPNAHPLNSVEADAADRPYVCAALNGDVDNHAELRALAGLSVASDITTDAKVIPTLVARRMADGDDPVDAFRATVASFEGSVAIGATCAATPGRLYLALRGSGQALYVGLADDAFVVASEPYGVVEETSRYVRMDGEVACGADGGNGQIVVLEREHAGTTEGIVRLAYDGTALPVTDVDVHTADITTRDIDRAGAPHFLLKEIHQSPSSVRKTIRGKVVQEGALLRVELPDATLPPRVRARLASGEIHRIITTGQGTAAVAGQGVAAVIAEAFRDTAVRAYAVPATELSGFELADDMSDTLVIAISQSGTTTDTNRTVDLVRARGASVVSIVNRRNSDLVERSDGVLYTSDGRDLEMAVPSTKAFYAQIAAGVILAWALAAAAGRRQPDRAHRWLDALRRLPDALERVLARRADIAAAAQRFAPPHRYWAVVGNGPNRVAANELRIKLSELCYKSISCDATEDKKHIDLSSEPLIVVCAPGLSGSTGDDVAKEVAIFRAHKAVPIVIASEGDERFGAAVSVIEVPALHPGLDFVLAAMAGHLFGYEAAVAIDAQARCLREARAELEQLAAAAGDDPAALATQMAEAVQPAATTFFEELRSGALDGHFEASSAVTLASLFRYAIGAVPLDVYEAEYGKVASPGTLLEHLVDELNDAVDQLTRPIDAIKHQAKTVTVGISRAEETFAAVPLVQGALRAGAARDRIGYRALRTLAALDPAVVSVDGYTRYEIQPAAIAGESLIHVLDKGGLAADIPSRTEHDPRLRGTKRRAVTEREVWVSRGARDGRTIILIPESKDNEVVGLTLLHVTFADRLAPDVFRELLSGYRGRYGALVDAVTETEPSFDDAVLGELPVVDVLVEPVYSLAEHWRGR